MTNPIIESFGILALFLALLLSAFAPVAERRGGAAAATGALLVALALLVLAVLAGLIGGGALGWLVAAVAALLLVWAAIAYTQYRSARAAAASAMRSTPPVQSGTNCRSRLTTGSAVVDGPDKESWRTYLFTVFSTAPSNGELKTKAKAWGGAYYVLYFTTGEAEAVPTVTIVCEDGNQGGSCLADGSETGSNDVPDPPVRVRVVNAIAPSGNRVRVTTVMGAALNASGGPSVQIAPGGIGATLTFPDASLASQTAMGTYRWICEPVEG